LPAVAVVRKLQTYHPVVETVSVPTPNNAKEFSRLVAGNFHRHVTSRLQVEPGVDARAGIVNQDNLGPVEKNASGTILAAQDDGDLNRNSATVPLLVHNVDRAYPLPSCGLWNVGIDPCPSRSRAFALRHRPVEEKVIIVEGSGRVND
jgi:hypothetical protein